LCSSYFEAEGNPIILHNATLASHDNMEGKEVRFGIGQSVLTAEATSTSSTGSYNSMHDSFTPLGGMVPLINMLVGQFFFGGLGGGIYGIILWVMLTMFVVGLMVGRTPEYVGKKIGAIEMKLVVLYTLATPIIVLVLTAIAVTTKEGLAGLTTNTGPHGLSEIICAFASSNANNGQNFAGLSANTPFYNIATAIAMMVGRFCLAIPALALAGRVNLQPARQPSVGTMPSDTPLFVATLLAVILIMGSLSYMPMLLLGPVLEHYLMHMGWLI
jgi:K+-transporting ATPase ATPase A chain